MGGRSWTAREMRVEEVAADGGAGLCHDVGWVGDVIRGWRIARVIEVVVGGARRCGIIFKRPSLGRRKR